MRKTLVTSAALFGLALSLPAFAQNASSPWAHQPGTGESGPASSTASNIDQADAHSAIAPHLPEPPQGQNAGPEVYLRDAQHALMHNHTGLAQQSLEMAETRLLDRSTLPADANTPDQSPEIRNVTAALNALGHRDVPGARRAIQTALANAPGAMAHGIATPAADSPGLATPPGAGNQPQPDANAPTPAGAKVGGSGPR
jgi:hypothetical protein